jgi:hypothetical protein
MKMKLINSVFVLVVLIFLLVINTFPQSGLLMSVYGQVLDLNTNDPLESINVSIVKIVNDKAISAFEEISDSNGFFEIRYLEAGKYRFLVEIPSIGMIYIGNIGTYINSGSINATQNTDFYSIEIEDGKNLNLNIFLGESTFPKIERKDFKVKNSIDFYMYYIGDIYRDDAILKTESRQMRQSCPGFNFYPPGEPIQVPDNERIMLNGHECTSLFGWQLDLTTIIIPKRCIRGKCEFNTTNAVGRFYPKIQCHSSEWIKETWRVHKELVLTDACATCLNQSHIEHEKYHAKMSPAIAEEEYCKLLEIVKNSDICCQRVTQCKSALDELFTDMLNSINRRIFEETEQRAWNEFENYYNKNCFRHNNENPCLVPYPDILIRE